MSAGAERGKLNAVFGRAEFTSPLNATCGVRAPLISYPVGLGWAEGAGFEPAGACTPRLFKSLALVHSAIPPGREGSARQGLI